MAGMIIVGAGECGVRAAFALREAGFDEQVTLIGSEPHLPYERPPLSKSHPPGAKFIAPEQAYADANIELLRGRRVDAIYPSRKSLTLDDGTKREYDRLLLATGAKARLFPGMVGAKTLRTVDDAQDLLGRIGPASTLAIVGGGFIGLELAATARNLGAIVFLVEAADSLMARAVPAEVAAVAEQRHLAEGVELILGAKVKSANEHRVELEDGSSIEADMVVAGVGAVPNTDVAEKAGLAIENGIVVDQTFRTSLPDIFAAGDCCSFPYRNRRVRLESWRAAQDHGNHVARAMMGETEPYSKVPWFWSDQYDLTLQVAGLAEAGKLTIRRDIAPDAFIIFQTGDGGELVAASGIGVGNAVAKDIRLAEMMIERGIAPDPEKLADPSINLKTLLKG